MPIVKGLLKYGQENFSVLILEYTGVANLVTRETHFITTVLPYYNVLKQGYSSLGYRHTEATKKILSELAKNKVHSDITKALISRTITGDNNPFYDKTHSLNSKLKMIKANSSYPLYIYNSYRNLQIIYPSVNTLAKLINSNHATIVNYMINENLYRGVRYFSNIPFNLDDTPLVSD